MEDLDPPQASDAAKEKHHSSRFRFKSNRRSRHDDGSHSDSHRVEKRRHSPHSHRTHHKSRRRDQARGEDEPSAYDDTYLPNARSSNYLESETAFRESLFDALADDEGAAFWEGVYGQPIHSYPSEKVGPGGELEQMTEDEYAAYVRARMYEKTHQHVIEERVRREELKRREKLLREEGQRAEREGQRFERDIEESLRRGVERKKKTQREKLWQQYIEDWESFKQSALKRPNEETGTRARDQIPWPNESRTFKDVQPKLIEDFFDTIATAEAGKESSLKTILKVERVRWHPDKMQQSFRGQKLDEATLKAVTLVFQVIDRMWSELQAS
jgi:hypothetical protein